MQCVVQIKGTADAHLQVCNAQRHYGCKPCMGQVCRVANGCACKGYALAAGLQDAYDDMIEMFTHFQEAFPIAEVLGPACVQMANPKDIIKLAREADILL